jgi:hypothetical protein
MPPIATRHAPVTTLFDPIRPGDIACRNRIARRAAFEFGYGG